MFMRNQPWTVRAGTIYLIALVAPWLAAIGLTAYVDLGMAGATAIYGGFWVVALAIVGMFFFALLEIGRSACETWRTKANRRETARGTRETWHAKADQRETARGTREIWGAKC